MGDRRRGLVLTEQGYRYLIESRHFESNGALSEPKVWNQLLAETGASGLGGEVVDPPPVQQHPVQAVGEDRGEEAGEDIVHHDALAFG